MARFGPYSGDYESARERDEELQHNRNVRKQEMDTARALDLTMRLDRMALYTEALWVILRDRLQIPEEELLDMVRDIDLSDGHLDGKVRQTAVTCPSCGRTISKRRTACIYCGTEILRPPFGSI